MSDLKKIIFLLVIIILLLVSNSKSEYFDVVEDLEQLEKVSELDLSVIKPQILNPNKKIAFVYVYTPNISDYAKHSIINLKNYVLKHDYTLIIYDKVLSDKVSPCWNKVLAILANLKSYDYLVWFDADAIIFNPSIPIQYFINANKSKDLLICYDCAKDKECVNSGIMIIANTDWAYRLFEKTWDSWIPHGHNDQNVLYYTILSEVYPEYEFSLKYPEICKDDIHEKIAILPENKFNSHITNYLNGDFVIHLMGLNKESRINIMRQINTVLGLDNYEPSDCIKALNMYGKKEISKEIRDDKIPLMCYINYKKLVKDKIIFRMDNI
jgi:hypothetical protein